MKPNIYNYQLIQSNDALNILSQKHPVFLYNVSLNPYSGCIYGCQYCYSILDENIPNNYLPKIYVKTNLPYLFNKLATNKTNKEYNIALGTLFEPYQPAEKEFQLSRSCIEICIKNEFPLIIFTKSEFILKDFDLLSKYSQEGKCIIIVSISTIDNKLIKIFEPLAPTIKKRLNLLKQLKSKKILCCVALMPIIPYINDNYEQFDLLFRAIKNTGIEYIIPSVLVINKKTIRERFYKLLTKYFNKIIHRYDALYDNDKMPSLTYGERIIQQINELSKKYDLKLGLPIENYKFPNSINIGPLT